MSWTVSGFKVAAWVELCGGFWARAVRIGHTDHSWRTVPLYLTDTLSLCVSLPCVYPATDELEEMEEEEPPTKSLKKAASSAGRAKQGLKPKAASSTGKGKEKELTRSEIEEHYGYAVCCERKWQPSMLGQAHFFLRLKGNEVHDAGDISNRTRGVSIASMSSFLNVQCGIDVAIRLTP